VPFTVFENSWLVGLQVEQDSEEEKVHISVTEHEDTDISTIATSNDVDEDTGLADVVMIGLTLCSSGVELETH